MFHNFKNKIFQKIICLFLFLGLPLLLLHFIASLTPLGAWDELEHTPGLARCLLFLGASPHVSYKYGITPLHETKSLAITRHLLDYGADPNAVGFDGIIPLHGAASDEAARLLIERGANVNGVDGCASPLAFAAACQGIRRVRLLLALGADVNDSYALFMHAKDIDIIKLFLDHGANINAQHDGNKNARIGSIGETALHTAIRWGDDELAAALLQCGADPTIRDNNGKLAKDYQKTK